MSKHFYPEAVYNDQGEKPQMRWRKRRTFTEIPASYDDDDVDDAKPQRTNNTDASKTKPVLQNASVSAFYLIFFFKFYKPLRMLCISV